MATPDAVRALEGQRALVTGGGTGIGFGITRCLLEAGVAVTIAARRLEVLEEAAKALRAEIPDAALSVVECDITKADQVERAVAVAAGPDGCLEIAVANAGSAAPGPFLLLDDEAWRFCCELNVIGTASTIRHAALAMRERGGSIVAISSAGAAAPEKSMAAYSSTKAALDMMVKCAARELGPYGIRVNSIQPGFVPHAVLEQVFPDELRRELIEQRTPLRRAGKPEEIGDMVVYLAGSGGSWITGQVIGVDGGMTAQAMGDLTPIAEMVHGKEAVRDALEPQRGNSQQS